MTDQQARQQGYTHKGMMYGISGYVKFEDDYGMEFVAKNWILDLVHECIVYLDSLIGFYENGFLVKVTGKL